MPTLLVAGSEEGAGATTLAVGLAHRLAYAGHAVRLARLEGDARAAADAATFAALDFAEASPAALAESGLGAANGVTIVEAPPGIDHAALASRLGAQLVLVTGPGGGAPATAAPVVVHASSHAPAQPGPARPTLLQNHSRAPGPLRIPEDSLLAAPTVGELIAASRARVLARSAEGDAAVCQHIVIGAISHDSDEPYFGRFPRKAVLTRAEKVDVALSALRTDTRCLILTGGSDPSPYLLDRVASDRATTLLVSPEGTVETMRNLEASFGRAPFAGSEKAERIGALVAAAIDDAALAALVPTTEPAASAPTSSRPPPDAPPAPEPPAAEPPAAPPPPPPPDQPPPPRRRRTRR